MKAVVVQHIDQPKPKHQLDVVYRCQNQCTDWIDYRLNVDIGGPNYNLKTSQSCKDIDKPADRSDPIIEEPNRSAER